MAVDHSSINSTDDGMEGGSSSLGLAMIQRLNCPNWEVILISPGSLGTLTPQSVDASHLHLMKDTIYSMSLLVGSGKAPKLSNIKWTPC